MTNSTSATRWRCDVCQEQTFATLEEACRHEGECRKTCRHSVTAASAASVDGENESLQDFDIICDLTADRTNDHVLQPNTRWRCDYCNEKCFATLEETSLHEEQCRKVNRQRIQETNTADKDAADSSFVTLATKAASDQKEDLDVASVWMCNVCKAEMYENYEDCLRHEEQCRKSTRPQVSDRDAVAASQSALPASTERHSDSPVIHMASAQIGLSVDSNKATVKSRKRKPKSQSKQSAIVIAADGSWLSKKVEKPKKQNTSQSATLKHQHIPKMSSNKKAEAAAGWAALGLGKSDVKKLKQDHAASELLQRQEAKRLEEQKRNMSKSKAALSSKPKWVLNVNSPSSTTKKSKYSCPRFPSYTHVIPHNKSDYHDDLIQFNLITDVLPEAVVPQLKVGVQVRSSSVPDSTNYSANPVRINNLLLDRHLRTSLNDRVLSQALVVPASFTSTDKLWVDKHANVIVQASASLVLAKTQLLDWISEWKKQRQSANARALLRQEKLKQPAAKPKRKILKNRITFKRNDRADSDEDSLMNELCGSALSVKTKSKLSKAKPKHSFRDDFLSDSSEDDEQLSRLCILTGPVGCGKTGIVHYVASQSGCTLLELNTSSVRSAQAIKKCIGEATQSLSSIQLLQDKAKSSTSPALIDSDDESDKGTVREGLTMILIDETDIVFEEAGDTNFWTAISDLSRKSKVPVILTSNTFPRHLPSTIQQYIHIPMSKPNDDEFCAHLASIVKMENINITSESNLKLLSQLYSNDLRRSVNEIQLYSNSLFDIVEKQDLSHAELTTKKAFHCQDSIRDKEPRIDFLRPFEVSANRYTIVTVSGQNLNEAFRTIGRTSEPDSDSICIGNALRVRSHLMNSNTAFVVVPPVKVPAQLLSSANIYSVLNESYAAKFISVSFKDTIFSESRIQRIELVDGTVYAEVSPLKMLEIDYLADSDNCKPDIGNCSEEEIEMDNDSPAFEICPFSESELRLLRLDIDFSRPYSEEANKLLEEHIAAYKSIHDNDHTIDPLEPVTSCMRSECDIVDFVQQFAFQSDCAYMSDCIHGCPMLSGSVRGLGFSLMDDIPQANESSKRPSEEFLIKSGWKDDYAFFVGSESFVQHPTSFRERQLLISYSLKSRGLQEERVASVDVLSTDQNNDIVWSRSYEFNSEEDLFLTPTVSQTMLDHFSLDSQSPYLSTSDELMMTTLDKRRLAKFHLLTSIACDSIMSPKARQQHFYKLYNRNVDPLLSESEKMDDSLVLDYLPMLRAMAVYERAAQYASQETNAGPEGASYNTRKSRKRGRVHYFESLLQYSEHNDRTTNDAFAKKIGDTMAQNVLSFYKKVT